VAITIGVGQAHAWDVITGTTFAVTLNGCTAGRQLVALMAWVDPSDTLSLSSVADIANSESFTLIGSKSRQSTQQHSCQLAYLSNIVTGGSKTITATLSGTCDSASIAVVEFQGGDTTGFYDAGTDASAGGSSGLLSVSVTPSVANACIVAIGNSSVGAITPHADYTAVTMDNINAFVKGQYDVDVGAAGAKTVTMDPSGDNWWLIKAAAFKPAGGAPATTRGMPFGSRSTVFNGGRLLRGPIN
jgi:hypothetical protein